MTSKAIKLRDRAKLLALGVLSAGLYLGLYFNESDVLELSRRGQWWFLVPVAVAFLFSFVHGAFTGLFWHVLGVRPKKP